MKAFIVTIAFMKRTISLKWKVILLISALKDSSSYGLKTIGSYVSFIGWLSGKYLFHIKFIELKRMSEETLENALQSLDITCKITEYRINKLTQMVEAIENTLLSNGEGKWST